MDEESAPAVIGEEFCLMTLRIMIDLGFTKDFRFASSRRPIYARRIYARTPTEHSHRGCCCSRLRGDFGHPRAIHTGRSRAHLYGWLYYRRYGEVCRVQSSAGTIIIDEFAPYTWSGPTALDDWGAAFDANSKALGITEAKVTLGAPIVKNISSEQAYLIYSSVYAYKLKGTSMRETGRFALVLRKEDAAWKIATWTWTGPCPNP